MMEIFAVLCCVITKRISVALLLYPGLGFALPEWKQWRSPQPNTTKYNW